MRSETHPLGFRKIILATFGECQLRLHIWPAHSTFQEEKHNHRSWFVGIPLWGKFTDTRYAEYLDGEPHRITEVRSGWTGKKAYRNYAPPTPSGLVLTSEHARYPLIPWYCPRTGIHRFLPCSERLHLSLVFTGPGKSPTCRFWRNIAEEASATARDCPSTKIGAS